MTQVNKRKHAANKNKLLPRLEFHCQVANTCFVKNSPQKNTFLLHQWLSFFLQNFAVVACIHFSLQLFLVCLHISFFFLVCFCMPFIVGVFYTPPFTGVFLHTSFIWRVSTPLSQCVCEVIENSFSKLNCSYWQFL